MNDTRQSALRRANDPEFLYRYFSGIGLDIGTGADIQKDFASNFPAIQQLVGWDIEQRDPVHMDGAPADVFDFVHSHCLGRFANPRQVIARWLELVKPGGYLILTVPDGKRGEGGVPSTGFDADHKHGFTIYEPAAATQDSVNVLDLVIDASPIASCERTCLIREYEHNRRDPLDEPQDKGQRCAIEIVLRKRHVPQLSDVLDVIDKAEDESMLAQNCREALRLYPYRFETYYRVSLAVLRRDHSHELEALWTACVRRLPNEYLPRLFSALGLVALGKLNEGFRQREALLAGVDWSRRTTAQPPAYADWRGEPLRGKSIVIWSEFGLGDEIFFFRFARTLREHYGASHVTVVCQAPLVELFKASGEAAAIYAVEEAQLLPPHDYWVYPHAIPAWAVLDIDHLPEVVPYLRVTGSSAPTVEPCSRRALKVGVVFKGAPTHENDGARSLPSLGCLDPLFELEGIEFYVMQKGQGEAEAAEYAARLNHLHDLGPRLRSFGDTAKELEALDLLISVDTSAAHLAGAMGMPVWLMLPMYGDWRWHFGRDDSPWYPSARLFRERGVGWSEVVARVRQALIDLRDNR
ncbi:methyltransferase type 11 [Paraburkholderia nemoris]|uniref:methyltransferase domain-containing protein n=1 Tax=Paraburkholderia nemoris TaxID=2793076 RepID=UPI0038B7443A